MEINGAIRQAVAPSGVTRPAPAPEPAGRAGGSVPAPQLPREIVQSVAGDTGATAPHASRIRLDQSTERIVVEILNSQNEVVKQIPPEAFLHALEQARGVIGLILDQKT